MMIVLERVQNAFSNHFSLIFTFHFNRDSLKRFNLTEQGYFFLYLLYDSKVQTFPWKKQTLQEATQVFSFHLTIICICRFQAIAD